MNDMGKNVPEPIPPTFWMPESASTTAPGVDLTLDIINWICYFFFFGICLFMLWAMIKYRYDPSRKTGDAVTHHLGIELTWTIIPLLLVFVIFGVGMKGFINLREAPANSYDVNVTAQKWFWNFDHPKYGASESGILRVPAGKPVRLVMQSTDVTHSLFIPAFRVKHDVIPGRYSTLWFQCDYPGEYTIFCTEYCGTDHSKMLAQVVVLEESEFEKSIKDVASEYDRLSFNDLPYYAFNKLYGRCKSCHSLDGRSGTGPSFRGLWDRTVEGKTVFKDGSSISEHLVNGGAYEGLPENYIRESILVPSKHIVQGYGNAMPSFQGQLKERQLLSIVEFIKRLDELVDKDGNWIGPLPESTEEEIQNDIAMREN